MHAFQLQRLRNDTYFDAGGRRSRRTFSPSQSRPVKRWAGTCRLWAVSLYEYSARAVQSVALMTTGERTQPVVGRVMQMFTKLSINCRLTENDGKASSTSSLAYNHKRILSVACTAIVIIILASSTLRNDFRTHLLTLQTIPRSVKIVALSNY